MKKFLLILITLFFVALQGISKTNEFKNILHDLNLNKVSDGTFRVLLGTEIPYTDEIKVVKKSENSYYILLAETYSMVKSAKGGGIIREVNVETFPYVEQNYDNGYTKVSFITSRPVDFVINLTAKRASKFPVIDLVRLAKLEEIYKNDTFDYKNAIAQNNVQKLETLIPQKTTTPQKQEEKVVVKKVEKTTASTSMVAKQTQKQEPKSTVVVKKAEVVSKPVQKTQTSQTVQKKTVVVQKEIAKEALKVAEPVQTTKVVKTAQSVQTQTVAKKQETPAQVQKVEPKKVESAKKPAQEIAKQTSKSTPIKPELKKTEVKKPVVVAKKPTVQANKPQQPKVNLPSEGSSSKTKVAEVKKEVLQTDQIDQTQQIQDKVVNKEPEKQEPIKTNKNLYKLLTVLLATLATAIYLIKKYLDINSNSQITFATGENKENSQVIEVEPSEAQEETAEVSFENTLNEASEDTVQEAESSEEHFVNPNAEYTPIFTPESDEVIEQTEWVQENIEEEIPEVILDIIDENNQTQNDEQENTEDLAQLAQEIQEETIQKTEEFENEEDIQNEPIYQLEEDNFQYIDKIDSLENAESQNAQSAVMVLEKPEPPKVQKPEAPKAKILHRAEIANDRGLYLSEFLGNKALIGYVDDDIFVLYNFRKTPIKNNEVIFRLSEARVKEDLYFVMVDNMKFLIKTDRTSMELVQKFF